VRAVFLWVLALASGGPVLYGEGAVAHAGAIIARGGDPYGPERAGAFVAANYPPLAFVVAAVGEAVGPFFALRLASILSTLALAVAIGWRARRPVHALALGTAFLALFPVEVWGPAHKPDPLAMALTATAVLTVGPTWRRAGIAGTCGALAALAKPTSLLPLVVVLIYLLWREREAAVRALAVAVSVAALAIALSASRFDLGGIAEHAVRRNELPVDIAQLPSLLLVAVLALGLFVATAALTRDGRLRAYLAGAALVVLLGAREGATINYLLDLSVASSFALATIATRVRTATLPLGLAAQLVVAVIAFHPLDPSASVGAWGDPRRIAFAASLARTSPHLAEDSGVLVANGIDPVVDDLFLWSRLVADGSRTDDVTARVDDGEFATVIAEVPLDALAAAPGFERQRWSPALARAVLAAYRLDATGDHFYRYVPRRILVRAE
jgi:hypothetical protein